MHVHIAPDVVERRISDVSARAPLPLSSASPASSLKSHYSSTLPSARASTACRGGVPACT
jgi:hypothetical protein